jgi:hypothetical protein
MKRTRRRRRRMGFARCLAGVRGAEKKLMALRRNEACSGQQAVTFQIRFRRHF